MKIFRFLIILLFCVANKGVVYAQSYLNLGFETVSAGIPFRWMINNFGDSTMADAVEKTSGQYSLKITKSREKSALNTVFYTELSLGTGIVGDIRLKGKVKTHSLDSSSAGLLLVAFNQGKVLKEGTTQNKVDLGSSDWKEIDVTLSLDSAASRVVLGGFCQGQVTAWFDDLDLFIDGNRYDVPSLRSAPLTAKELEVLQRYCYPLNSYEPSFEGQDDLHILKELWGNAKILGLGEESHGTSEVYKMKHRLIKYFAENKIFDMVSLEANMPESHQLNQRIRKNQIDGINIKEQLHFWIYNTEEFKDLITWMASSNKEGSVIDFSGFDMQFTDGPIYELVNGLNSNTEALSAIKKLETLLNTIDQNHQKTNKLAVTAEQSDTCAHLIKIIQSFVSRGIKDHRQRDWLLQNIRVIEQYVDDSVLQRDKYMAENLGWLLEHHKSKKIIASGHNGHIMKWKKRMGSYLAQKYHDDYIAVGTTFNEGDYRAGSVYKAEMPFPGTYEYLLNSIDMPIFVVDLKKIKNERPPELEWLLQPGLSRIIGAAKRPFDFMEMNLSDSYDYLIFIKQVTPTKLIQ